MPYIAPQTLYSIKKKPFVVFVDKDSFPHARGKLSLKVYLKIFLWQNTGFLCLSPLKILDKVLLFNYLESTPMLAE